MNRSTAARVELALCLALPMGVFLAGAWLPGAVSIASLTILCACVLLAQGLVRDVWILTRARDEASGDGEQKVSASICVESATGSAGVAVGIVLVALQMETAITMSNLAWGGTLFTVLLFGFLMRDVVIRLRPLGFAREPDHVNVVFGWRAPPTVAADDR